MAPTYLDNLTHFLDFLTAYIHTVLALRDLYPRTTFLTAKFHNTPVFQSRHPTLCAWITDAVDKIRIELLNSTVARVVIVIYHFPEHGNKTGSAEVIERFMLDVSQFPAVSKQERERELEWASSDQANKDGSTENEEKGKSRTEVDVDVDLSEQFRAALFMLTTRCAQLKPLPPNCAFNIALELKDESDVDPPIGHPQAWIPVQPSLQKTGRKNAQAEPAGGDDSTKGDANKGKEGSDLGGVRTTPIRAVEAGVFRFETWVEEGKAKFKGQDTSQGSSFISSA
jgi:mitotic spindle assembly checkpoint protein MAD2B